MKLEKIKERSNSLGLYRRRQITIDSVYDKTISAIKLRIDKRQFIERIKNNKEKQLIENIAKRNKIICMENLIRFNLKRVKEKNIQSIKLSKLNQYNDMQQKAKQAFHKLHQLELMEHKMLKKLHNTLPFNTHI